MNKKSHKVDWLAIKGDLIIAGKLTLICFVSVLLLSTAHLLTYKKINANNLKTEMTANKYLMPEGVTFDKGTFNGQNVHNDEEYYYTVKNADGEMIGWTVAVMTSGYGGAMKVMAGFDKDMTVRNAKLLNNSETPGIGKRAEKDGYMDKFIGTGSDNSPIPVRKSMLKSDEVDSVTGATITFNGVSSGIKRASELLRSQQDTDSIGKDDNREATDDL